jgi:hypothetical protein
MAKNMKRPGWHRGAVQASSSIIEPDEFNRNPVEKESPPQSYLHVPGNRTERRFAPELDDLARLHVWLIDGLELAATLWRRRVRS